MASPTDERRGRLAGGHVLDDVPGVVDVVRGGHQRGLDRGGAPVRARLPEQRADAAHVRARHGSAGDDDKLHPRRVAVQLRGRVLAGPRGQDVACSWSSPGDRVNNVSSCGCVVNWRLL